MRASEGDDTVTDKIVDRLRRGVALEDGPAKFDEIEQIGGTDSHDWYQVLLKEGRNREVRRLWESQGCQVSRLKRVRYGNVVLPQPLLRGQSQELPEAQVESLRKELKLEEGPPPALTLQPVIGQRKAGKSTVHLGKGGTGKAYVNGQNSGADEGRELRRFDHVREDRGRGRGGPRKAHGGLTVSGDAAAKQSQKPFKQRADKGARGLPEGNPAAFRTWYVPDGVETGPTGHRNADGRGPKKPYGGAGAKKRGPGGAGGAGQGPRGGGQGPWASRSAGGGGGGGQGRPRAPYGHPDSAPSFPSDHANPGSFNPNAGPRGPRPGGNRGPKGGPGGRGPGGNRGPGGRPGGGGNRGPRDGNR